jgi:ABC-type Zn uptake system ZnuABC Zn-binding protein ZnuA
MNLNMNAGLRRLARGIGAVLLLAITCGTALWLSGPLQALQPPPEHYVVTIKPLEFILREVCGTRAEVSTLLKPGTNAHTYDPTPADARAVQTATALVWIGEDYDGWAGKLNAKSKLKLLPLLPQSMRLTLDEPCTHEGHGHHHHTHEIDDPHFFTDPLAVKALLPGLVRELTRLDPPGKADYEAGAAAFGRKLDSLHNELSNTLYPIKGAAVIQFHASFNYFIARYGLRNAGLIQQSPGKEPSPKELQAIVQQIRQERIKALFSETLLPKGPAAVIGEAASVPVFELDPSCGTSERAYADYAAWLRYNAGVFVKALK